MAAQLGGFNYRIVEAWGQGADGRAFGGVTPAVATDSHGFATLPHNLPPCQYLGDAAYPSVQRRTLGTCI